MSVKFGDSYTKEVQDANEGIIDKHSTVANERSIAIGGSQRVQADRNKHSTKALQGIVKVASAAAQTIGDRKQEQRYNDALNTATQEEQDRAFSERNKVAETIFGKSPERRAFQKATVLRNATALTTDLLESEEADIINFTDIEQYRNERVNPAIRGLMETQTDPEVRNELAELFIKAGDASVRNYIRKKPIHTAALQRREASEGILAAARLNKVATRTGSPEAQKIAQQSLEHAFDNTGASQEVLEELAVTSIVNELTSGDDGLLKFMQNSKRLEGFSEASLLKLQEGIKIKEGMDSTELSMKQTAVDAAIEDAAPNAMQLIENITTRFGAKTTQPNKLRERLAEVKVDKAKEQAAKDQRLSDRIEGNSLASRQSPEEKVEADTAIETRYADLQVQQARQELLQKQIDEGVPLEKRVDLHAKQTPEERSRALKSNPENLIVRWAGNAEFQPPILAKTIQDQSLLLNKEEFEPSEVTAIEENQNFLEKFRSKDAAHYAQSVRTKELLKNQSYLRILKSAGRNTRQALKQLKADRGLPKYEWNIEEPAELNEAVDSVLAGTSADQGFTKWLGLRNTTPENAENLRWSVQNAIRDAGTIAKRPEDIKRLAQDIMMHNSTKWGDTMLTDARAAVDKSVIPLADYAELLKKDTDFQQRWIDSRFNKDDTLTDSKFNTYFSKDGTRVTVSGHNANNAPVFIDIGIPTKEQDVPGFRTPEEETAAEILGKQAAQSLQRGN